MSKRRKEKVEKESGKTGAKDPVSRLKAAGRSHPRFSGTVTSESPETDPTRKRLKEAEAQLRRASH